MPPRPLPLRHRPDALLLDAGDTLVFFDGAAVAQVLAACGLQAQPASLEAAMHAAKQRYQAFVRAGGKHDDGWYVVMNEALTGAGVAASSAEAVLPALRAAHDHHNFWRRVPEGLPEALARARAAGMSLGVVSNSEGKVAEILDRVGLLPLLDVVVDSHLEGVHKPDPEIFRRALSRLRVPAERALFAGDIPEVDLGGAQAAGMAGVLIDPHALHGETPWLSRPSVAALVAELLALPAAPG